MARILVVKLVHGRYTAKMVQLRRMLAAERRAFRELLQLEQKQVQRPEMIIQSDK